ncbi:cupin domain-containing protein [Polaromonas sp.]|uniref:cupin domain-containing protein n=1 Tax=Polaromonas sp. TaxID=1869339 RepID=UPI00286D5D48|nr:cupin domain-containing protein [Polaromonas sp.]
MKNPPKPQAFVVTPQNYADPLNVLGIRITVLASNTATQGYEITLQQGDEGAGPPPHSHDWDESFYVLKGKVEIRCEDQTVACAPGTLVHVPAGTVHGYRFSAGGGELFEISGQGGFATRMFTKVSRALPPGPPDIAQLVGLLRQNGVTLAA